MELMLAEAFHKTTEPLKDLNIFHLSTSIPKDQFKHKSIIQSLQTWTAPVSQLPIQIFTQITTKESFSIEFVTH